MSFSINLSTKSFLTGDSTVGNLASLRGALFPRICIDSRYSLLGDTIVC